KVRQPLAKLMMSLPANVAVKRLDPYLYIIRDELNVKEVVGAESLDGYVSFSAKLNFKTAGPKLGKEVKAAASYIDALPSDKVKEFVKSGKLLVESLDGKPELTSDDVQVIRNERDGFAVEFEGGVTVALVTDLTDDLIDEGFAREMVNKIQNMRKTSGLEVTDHIRVRVTSSDRLRAAASRYDDFIRKETLAEQMEFLDTQQPEDATEWNINGEKAAIAVVKV
ncbi:MAG: isoleucine--tRNA ligase, partial [candidate division Zixibacteria bacterium]|nr:isoleucine--tRNA ligase [candidate division Zixibacteria bacterium]